MFKRKGRKKKPTVMETITELRKAQTTLEKRANHNRTLAATRFKEAKAAKESGNKEQAIAILKKRKRLLKNAEDADNQASTLDEQVNQLQSIAQMKTVAEALELARSTAENILRKLDVDKMERTRNELDDQKYRLQEFNNALVTFDDEEDAGLEDEFNRLGEDEEDALHVDNMPIIERANKAADRKKKVPQMTEEDRLLAELEGPDFQPPTSVAEEEEDQQVKKELELLGAKLAANRETPRD